MYKIWSINHLLFIQNRYTSISLHFVQFLSNWNSHGYSLCYSITITITILQFLSIFFDSWAIETLTVIHSHYTSISLHFVRFLRNWNSQCRFRSASRGVYKAELLFHSVLLKQVLSSRTLLKRKHWTFGGIPFNDPFLFVLRN